MSPPDQTRQRPAGRPGEAQNTELGTQAIPPQGSPSVQLSLDTYARQSDPPTSRAAARSLDPVKVKGQIADILVSIATRKGGAICAEIAADIRRDRGNTARRVTDSERRGFIRRDGVRIAPSGRLQTVWKATSLGLKVAARRIAETTT